MSDKKYYVNLYENHMNRLASPASSPFTLLNHGSKSLYHFEADHPTLSKACNEIEESSYFHTWSTLDSRPIMSGYT